MKWYTWLIILSLPTLLVLPQYGKWQWQNLPLLLFLLALLVGGKIYRYGKLVRLACKTKAALQRAGYLVEKVHLTPRTSYIQAKRRDKFVIISLLLCKKKYWRLHFPSNTQIEHYSVAKNFAVRQNGRTFLGGTTYTVCRRRRTLYLPKTRTPFLHIIMLDHLPNTVSDDVVGSKLGAGDKLSGGDALLFDLVGFEKHLSK